jgi:ATP synthase protein I
MKTPVPVSPPPRGASPADASRHAANWDDEDPLPHRLTAAEAAAFRDQRNSPSPWRVVQVQAQAGAVVALIAGVVFGLPALWSALYGAATAVVPSALMARAVTRMAESRSAVATAMSLMGWESAKIICAVAMLAAAKQVLPTVVWPVLLVALAVCLLVYWVALAWRPSLKN